MSPGPQQDSSPAHNVLSPQAALGPPPSKPLTKKRPHRRSPQACDECRLRKRACDAVEPCRPCQRAGLRCTYQFRRPVPPPTLRIRNLQDHLSLARSWLQHIKDHVPDVPGLDLGECLRTLDFTQPTPGDAPSPPAGANPARPNLSPGSAVSTPAVAGPEPTSGSVPPAERQSLGNMLAGHDRAVILPSGETCFYGAFSDISFALRTIELFRQGPGLQGPGEFVRIRGAFTKPFRLHAGNMSANSPYPDGTNAFFDMPLGTSHLLLSFLSGPEFKDMTIDHASEASMPLMHVIRALRNLTDWQRHRLQGCDSVTERAQMLFYQGVASLLPAGTESLAELQALLVAVNFILSTGRITAAHSIIGSASSLAYRLGFFVKEKAFWASESPRRTENAKTLATLLSLDMLIALILDIPTCLPQDASVEENLLELAQEYESEQDFQTAAMLRQVFLLLVPTSIRNRSRQRPAASATGDPDAVTEDIRLLETAHAGFRRWKRDVAPLLTSVGANEQDRIIRKDLENMYNFCQIIVFRSHLHFLRSVAVGGSMSKVQSYHALACLKIATATIAQADRPTDSTHLTDIADSWLGVYTIFSAVMCLVFLIAAHPGTARPSVAWQRAHRGIRILAACSCGKNIAAACLEVVKVVTTELSHTVYFDYDEIGRTVKRVCDGETSNTSPSQASPSMSTGGESLNGFMDIPADRMLFQADTLTTEFDFRDILHLSDTE